jgi:dCTP deaminase
LQIGEQVIVPPGQFGLLITQEEIHVPADAVALLSIKSKIKFGGLVNVSGFHVDPGFRGRLKFSVYNAGSENVILEVGAKTFIAWFADLDRATEDVYKGQRQDQTSITTLDVRSLQGEIASPGSLARRITAVETDLQARFHKSETELEARLQKLEQRIDDWKSTLLTVAATVIGGGLLAAITYFGSVVVHELRRSPPADGKSTVQQPDTIRERGQPTSPSGGGHRAFGDTGHSLERGRPEEQARPKQR